METREIGRSGIRASVVGLGCNNFGLRMSIEDSRAVIHKALDLGVSNVVFVEVESAAELKAGLAAMRFKSHGGTRPEAVGNAPAYWGLSEQEYKAKADLYPLNPNGELTNWTIVESKEGLAHLREIAAVPGIGVLWPGAGTLRLQVLNPGAFTWTEEQSRKNFDSIQDIVVPGKPESSRLLLHPLIHSAGGDEFHSGGQQFTSKSDPDWKTIADWVNGKK